jgi:hypothetical protein
VKVSFQNGKPGGFIEALYMRDMHSEIVVFQGDLASMHMIHVQALRLSAC